MHRSFVSIFPKHPWLSCFLVTLEKKQTHGEEDEEALVLLSDTVVDPGTVVVHLTDAAFTDAVEEEHGSITDFLLFWLLTALFYLDQGVLTCSDEPSQV